MNVFVSASSVENKYDDFLIGIAKILNKYNDKLYVGGRTGSMKILCDNANNKSIVITKMYKEELLDSDMKDAIITENSYLRTKQLIDNSDMFIIMPGSIGSVAELLTLMEAKRSDNIKGKILIVNIDGYYDTLLMFFNETYDKGYIKEKIEKYYTIVNSITDLEKIRSDIYE